MCSPSSPPDSLVTSGTDAMTGSDPKLGRLPWAVHPWPREDELFTSWVVRFAAANMLTPRRLLAFLTGFQTTRFDPREIDFRNHLDSFSKISGVPVPRLAEMFPRWSQISPHYRATGLSYRCCPECLYTDEVPYLRVGWTDPEAVLCVKHRTPLIGYCSHCGVPFEVFAFGLRDRPQPKDLLHCRNQNCRYPVMYFHQGTLAPDHGALWLEDALASPDRAGLAELPSGTQVERAVLRWMVDRLPSDPLRQALLPFDLDEKLTEVRGRSGHTKLQPWLMFAQLLVQPSWIRSELLTALAEQVVRAMEPSRGNRKVPQTVSRDYVKEASMLLFFHLVYDQGVQVIDRDTFAHHDFAAALREHQRFLGLDTDVLLGHLPWFTPRLPER